MKTSSLPDLFKEYLRQFPSGKYISAARTKLAALESAAKARERAEQTKLAALESAAKDRERAERKRREKAALDSFVANIHNQANRAARNARDAAAEARKRRSPGFREVTYTNGERYAGGHVGKKLSGHGVYYWTGGFRYEGEWRDGKMNGLGIFFYVNQRWEGEWRDGRPEGRGVQYRSHTGGTVVEAGTWRNDKLAEPFKTAR